MNIWSVCISLRPERTCVKVFVFITVSFFFFFSAFFNKKLERERESLLLYSVIAAMARSEAGRRSNPRASWGSPTLPKPPAVFCCLLSVGFQVKQLRLTLHPCGYWYPRKWSYMPCYNASPYLVFSCSASKYNSLWYWKQEQKVLSCLNGGLYTITKLYCSHSTLLAEDLNGRFWEGVP